MATNAMQKAEVIEETPANVITINPTNRPERRRQIDTGRHRFKLIPFTNRAGSRSWRVTGTKRDGTRIRENFKNETAAQAKQIQLEAEYLQRQPDAPTIRATTLTDAQARLAETIFRIVDADQDVLTAVQFWKQHRHEHTAGESPRLDDAHKEFLAWLDTSNLRPRTRLNLRTRTSIFVNAVRNHRVGDLSPDIVEKFIEQRGLSLRSRINDRLALSRFFRWCLDRPRRWLATNPCREIRVPRPEAAPPAVLSVEQVRALLCAAMAYKKGAMLPYLVATVFLGLRPTEALRLTWEQVNLLDGEIRLESAQSKTKQPRTIRFNDGPKEQRLFNLCVQTWLAARKGRPFYLPSWRRYFATVRKNAKLETWTPDIARHTAISHFFRATGSYGLTAEQFGNSESIIKAHYQGRVSSEETRRFYALRPAKR